METPENNLSSAPPRRRPLFWIGVLLFLAAPILYAVQFSLAWLFVPWYAPPLCTLGVLCMAASIWRRFGIGRAIGLAFCALVAAFGWFMVLAGTNTPPYVGPAQVGLTVPPFATQLAGGKALTAMDLGGDQDSIVHFFRGRW